MHSETKHSSEKVVILIIIALRQYNDNTEYLQNREK